MPFRQFEQSPHVLLPVVRRLTEWLGPVVSPEQLPRFEISYREGKTEYLDMYFGAMTMYSIAMLPEDISEVELHLEQARCYGRDMLALDLTPQSVLQKALTSPELLQTFLLLLDQIGGTKEDPLRKKSSLLAMILIQRPENFLPLREDEEVPPIIDYHLLRSVLRIGLIDMIDEKLNSKLSDRSSVSATEERAVRYPAYQATEAVHILSGKSVAGLTWFFYCARKWCPEMSEPQCSDCLLEAECAKYKELFQPVFRTSLY